ncbi:MAG: HRDC domain-containing protein [Planctomycetales bacterium]|nr:HRDC domain-containing protein [Planctomycetales bacterium]
MPAPIITRQRQLDELCDRLRSAPEIAFDTEFVSEDTFYPELCLIQIATRVEMAVVDPQEVDVKEFWQLLVDGDHVTVFHAGREELNFILRAVGAAPKKLFDVQLATGFCGNEYPASYGAVVGRILSEKPQKGEQRTDWRRRPLTKAQVDYALEDVRFLLPLFDKLTRILYKRERLEWFKEELDSWRDDVVAAQDRKDWRRVSGIGSLRAHQLAIVRELWFWRYEQAERLNQPPKRLLRDDLLVEIAKRKIDKPDQILAIRGMQRSALKRSAGELADCVKRGMATPLEKLARGPRRELPTQLHLLGQFLTPALTSICRRAEVAASLAGTASDVRDLIAERLGYGRDDEDSGPPRLLTGWRAELVGNLIDDLLAGRKSIRITDAKKEDPLAFDAIG